MRSLGPLASTLLILCAAVIEALALRGPALAIGLVVLALMALVAFEKPLAGAVRRLWRSTYRRAERWDVVRTKSLRGDPIDRRQGHVITRTWPDGRAQHFSATGNLETYKRLAEAGKIDPRTTVHTKPPKVDSIPAGWVGRFNLRLDIRNRARAGSGGQPRRPE